MIDAAPDIDLVLQVMIFITGAHTVLNSLEHISTRDRFGEDGILNWNVSKLYVRAANPLAPLFEPILRYPRFRLLLFARLLSGLALASAVALAAAGRDALLWTIAPWLLLFVFFTTVCSCFRHQAGLSGDDHMSLVVTAGLFVATAFPDGSFAQLAAVVFIAVQVTLSYFIAGVHKLFSTTWRDGSALEGVMSTKTWGHSGLHALFQRYPRVNLLAAWTIIGFEVLFPLWLLTSPDVTVLFLAVAFVFHVGNAVFMGLNGFLVMFPAAYPAVYYTSYGIDSLLV